MVASEVAKVAQAAEGLPAAKVVALMTAVQRQRHWQRRLQGWVRRQGWR